MTFIASVIAKKGVVIIADSLVTTERPILNYKPFIDFIDKQPKPKRGKLKIDPIEISKLFEFQPSFTKDYQEKLFRYTNNTAITIAGSVLINEKKIDQLIESAIKSLRPSAQTKKTIDDKIEDFKKFIEAEVKEHIKRHGGIRNTVFIITHYIKATHTTRIFKVFINKITEVEVKADPKYEVVSLNEQPSEFKVVCEGQNRISERILFGDIELISYLIPKIFDKIKTDFKIKEKAIPKDYIENLSKDNDILTSQFFEDIKMNKIKELSLQQAYDLASLLMRIERDIQKYTKNIPTVGGVVKIAKIDDKGFSFITGDGINHSEKF